MWLNIELGWNLILKEYVLIKNIYILPIKKKLRGFQDTENRNSTGFFVCLFLFLDFLNQIEDLLYVRSCYTHYLL